MHMRRLGLVLAATLTAIGLSASPANAGTGSSETTRFALDGHIYGYANTANCPQVCTSFGRANLAHGKHSEHWLEVVTPTVGNNVNLAYYGVDLLPDAAQAARISQSVKNTSKTNPDTNRPAQAVNLNDKTVRALHQWYYVSDDNNGCYVATGGVYKNAFIFAVVTSGDQTGVQIPCVGEEGWTV